MPGNSYRIQWIEFGQIVRCYVGRKSGRSGTILVLSVSFCQGSKGLSLPADRAGLAVRAIDDLSDMVCRVYGDKCRQVLNAHSFPSKFRFRLYSQVEQVCRTQHAEQLHREDERHSSVQADMVPQCSRFTKPQHTQTREADDPSYTARSLCPYYAKPSMPRWRQPSLPSW
jgi:hypothetical protein